MKTRRGNFNLKHIAQEQGGYALVLFMILMVLGVLGANGSLMMVSSHAKTNYATAQRSHRYYEVESAVTTSAAWLRENSQNILEPFTKQNFYSSFTITAPSVGGNDSNYSVPTKLKLYGTNNSVILSSDGGLVSSSFPTTNNVITGAAFNAANEFSAINFDNTLVRVTLVDALPIDEAKDYGAPPSANPDTHFFPVFRVDAMNEMDGGVHLFAYVKGRLMNSIPGFFGLEGFDVSQECDSYKSSDGPYGGSNQNANCSIASEGEICIHSSETVFGTVDTLSGMSSSNSCDGTICADIDCNNEIEACEGYSCPIPYIVDYADWNSYCPATQGDYEVNGTETITVASAAPADRCWSTFSTKSNATAVLTTTDYEYFFETLDLKNNSLLDIQPDDPNASVTIYTTRIVGDSINGNQAFNMNNKPPNLTLVYLGTDGLTLNGTADIKAKVIAPNAVVDISGNFDFFGSVMAKQIVMTGSSDIHFDEDLAQEQLSDISFRLEQVSQYYR